MPNRPLSFGFRRVWCGVIVMIASAAGPAAASEAPTLRLPQTVKPVRYALEATLDPASDSYAGRVDIELNATAETDVVWLHAVDLQISGATLGGTAAETTQVGDFLGVKPAKALPAGATHLHLRLQAPLPPPPPPALLLSPPCHITSP